MADASPLLEVRDLRKEFPPRPRLFGKPGPSVIAVDGVSFEMARGEILGVVGESGSGKTTIGRCVLRLIEPTSGRVALLGEDVTAADGGALARMRRHMQTVFQDPFGSLNPRMTVRECVAEPLLLQGAPNDRALDEKIVSLLGEVGLSAAEASRLPHALSGGQRQRVGIARAIALAPELVVADEPVSALDVSVRAQILALVASLREKHGIGWLFIAHDLRAVAQICDRLAVLYLGRILEIGPTTDVLARPRNPYTESLLASVPITDPRDRQKPRKRPRGEIPDLLGIPTGCRFHPRCPYVQEICKTEDPPLVQIGAQQSACHFARELSLEGMT